jgi:hypothetical protein
MSEMMIVAIISAFAGVIVGWGIATFYFVRNL